MATEIIEVISVPKSSWAFYYFQGPSSALSFFKTVRDSIGSFRPLEQVFQDPEDTSLTHSECLPHTFLGRNYLCYSILRRAALDGLITCLILFEASWLFALDFGLVLRYLSGEGKTK